MWLIRRVLNEISMRGNWPVRYKKRSFLLATKKAPATPDGNPLRYFFCRKNPPGRASRFLPIAEPRSNKTIAPAFSSRCAPSSWCVPVSNKTPAQGGVSNLRPAGVEPTFPASEADALSIELRARKAFLLFYQNLLTCAFKFVACVPTDAPVFLLGGR